MVRKILMVLEGEFPHDDRVFKEATTLIKNGFDVYLACYTFTKKPSIEQYQGIHIIRKAIPNIIYKSSVAALRSPIYFNWWKKYLNGIFSKQHFDIVHIHDLPLAKVGAYLKTKYKTKLVVDLHENWPSHLSKATHTNTAIGKILSPNNLWQQYEKQILTNADRIVTVVDEMKNRIAELGHEKSKLFVLQNTINPESYPSIKSEPNADYFTLFFAGGLNIERGLQYVIPAVKQVINDIPNIKLQIVGKGSYLDALIALVKELQLENVVEFLGWKPLEEVMNLTAKANLSLIPHLKWEQTDCSSPNKLFQCMLSGVPLLVSNCNSVARIVNETQCGLVYKYNNVDELAKRLKEMHANPELMTQMGENGKNAVLKTYNWENASTEFVTMYKNIFS